MDSNTRKKRKRVAAPTEYSLPEIPGVRSFGQNSVIRRGTQGGDKVLSKGNESIRIDNIYERVFQ